MGRKVKDITGNIYGDYKVIKRVLYHEKNDKQHSFWLCKCLICGEEKILPKYQLTKANSKNLCITKRKIIGRKGVNYYEFCDNYIKVYDMKGKYFFIDLEDYEKINKYYWSVDKQNYVYRYKKKEDNEEKLLHRFIMSPPKNRTIDHINRNPLDNRKENLRICTLQENCRNKNKLKSNKSGIIGIVIHHTKWGNYWRARIKINGKIKELGELKDKEEAIKRRLKAEKEYFGEFAPQKHLFEKYGI